MHSHLSGLQHGDCRLYAWTTRHHVRWKGTSLDECKPKKQVLDTKWVKLWSLFLRSGLIASFKPLCTQLFVACLLSARDLRLCTVSILMPAKPIFNFKSGKLARSLTFSSHFSKGCWVMWFLLDKGSGDIPTKDRRLCRLITLVRLLRFFIFFVFCIFRHFWPTYIHFWLSTTCDLFRSSAVWQAQTDKEVSGEAYHLTSAGSHPKQPSCIPARMERYFLGLSCVSSFIKPDKRFIQKWISRKLHLQFTNFGCFQVLIFISAVPIFNQISPYLLNINASNLPMIWSGRIRLSPKYEVDSASLFRSLPSFCGRIQCRGNQRHMESVAPSGRPGRGWHFECPKGTNSKICQLAHC